MEEPDDRSSGEDSISSGGSAYSAKYTEGSEVSRTGSMLRGSIPTLHALESSDSDDEDASEGNRQKNTRKLVKAHLLNEATLEELEFGAELTKEQLLRVKQMLMSHSQCFAQTLSDVGRTDIIEHHIRLKPDARPVYRPGFKRFSQPEVQFIEKEVQKQLVAGIIREEDGPWCAPVTLGMKKNGNYRFCVAYIGLNAQTEGNHGRSQILRRYSTAWEDSSTTLHWMDSVDSIPFPLRRMTSISLPSALRGVRFVTQ